MNRKNDITEKLKKAGLKVTPQRLAVFEALTSTTAHPSAEIVYKEVKKLYPNISLDTVSRTLQKLAENGLAITIPGSGDAKRFDGDIGTHHHFRCLSCKRIIDFNHKPFDNFTIPEQIDSNFVVISKTVLLEGICDSCMNEKK